MVEVSIVSRFREDDDNLLEILNVVSSAWVPQVISRLDYYGQLRYNQLKRSLRGISSTSMSRTLALLERKGIVTRTVHESKPPRVTYSLTNKGLQLGRLVAAMRETGKNWNGKEATEVRVSEITK